MKNKMKECIRPLTRNIQTLNMKITVGTKIMREISADLLSKEAKVNSKELPVLDIQCKKRKLEANCKCSKKGFKIPKSTNGVGPDLKVRSVTTSLARYGCHNLSYLSLKSSEAHCPPPCMSDIKRRDPYFRFGWLHHEIVDSYLFLLERELMHVLYIRRSQNNFYKFSGKTSSYSIRS